MEMETDIFLPNLHSLRRHLQTLDTSNRVVKLVVDTSGALFENAHLMKAPQFLLRGFKRPREVITVALGKLERQVLEETWRRRETTVRDVFIAFEEKVAYTTLMTTLDRLYKKNLLDRHKDGRAFSYTPLVTPEELEQGIREDVIDGLLGQGSLGEPILACIVDAIGERDLESLDELDRLIKKKRQELKRKS
jgi:predicted transcriptional regulator